MSFRIEDIKILNGSFCNFEPSGFQSKGHNQRIILLWNSWKKSSLSIQTLIQEIKSVLQKDKLEHRDNPIRRALLQHSVNQNSNFDMEKSLHDVYKRIVRLKWEFIDWQPDGKTKQVVLQKIEFDYTHSLIWLFWCIKIQLHQQTLKLAFLIEYSNTNRNL